MQLLNKKFPLSVTVSVTLVVSAAAYSISYNVAMKKFNSVVSYNYEKQQMYSKLSDIDYAIRQEYIGAIDENKLVESICNGYIDGIDNIDCKYYNEADYKQYLSEKNALGNSISYNKIEDNIGYIRINNLSSESGSTFISAMQALQTAGVNNIIIDLRNVSEGDIESTGKILNYVLPSGDIVSSIDKKGNKELVYKSTSDGVDCNFAVLCNGYTSGISEVMASALKDSGNAKIIGEKTAGRALKEKNLQLSDGSVIMFPIAYYVTQSDKMIYGNGISPDIEISMSSDKNDMLENKELQYEEDEQLNSAISYFKE